MLAINVPFPESEPKPPPMPPPPFPGQKPVREPDPSRLPDEAPLPNPDENDEPPHIHVEFGDKLAKYWLEPVELASSQRVRSHELGAVRRLVVEHRTEFLKAWHDHFDAAD